MTRVLITGSAGFIGSHVARLAIAHGHEVHGVDLGEALGGTIVGLVDHRASKAERTNFTQIVAQVQPGVTIHAAGRASVRESMGDPAADFVAGPALTFALLDALRRHAPTCRILFLSSAAVYGNSRKLPIGEETPPRPVSPYGFHKLQSELLCREFTKVYGMKTAIARIFTAYGEGLRRQVLWDICQMAVWGGELMLRGTGGETRDFLHVRDVARGLLQIVENAPMDGEVYNLASGEAVRIDALAIMVLEALDLDRDVRFDGKVPTGDPLHWRADIRKMGRLGVVPSVSLSEGISAYSIWARDQVGARQR